MSTTASTCWWDISPPPGSSGGTTPWLTCRYMKTRRTRSQCCSVAFPFPTDPCVFVQASRQTPSNYLSRVWWNPVFNFLERNVQTTVPIAFSWPITPPSSCRQRYRIVEGGRDEWAGGGQGVCHTMQFSLLVPALQGCHCIINTTWHLFFFQPEIWNKLFPLPPNCWIIIIVIIFFYFSFFKEDFSDIIFACHGLLVSMMRQTLLTRLSF